MEKIAEEIQTRIELPVAEMMANDRIDEEIFPFLPRIVRVLVFGSSAGEI